MLLHVLFLAPRWPNKHFGGGGGRRRGREWKPTTKREEKRGGGKAFVRRPLFYYTTVRTLVCVCPPVWLGPSFSSLLYLILFPRRTQTTGWRKNASFPDTSIRFSKFRHRLGPAKKLQNVFPWKPCRFSTNLYHYIHFSPPHSLPIPPLENKFSRFPSLPSFDPSR